MGTTQSVESQMIFEQGKYKFSKSINSKNIQKRNEKPNKWEDDKKQLYTSDENQKVWGPF